MRIQSLFAILIRLEFNLVLFFNVLIQGSFPRIGPSTELTGVPTLGQIHPVAHCVVLHIHLGHQASHQLTISTLLTNFAVAEMPIS